MVKVSVIVPVYNTSAYIARCCHSLFLQTLVEMQYVFVDDGSTDGSIDIVRSIVSQYPYRVEQTLILTQSHQGVSSARQSGLNHAKGEYIIHCDSDDWVECTAYEQLYIRAVSTQADIVSFGFQVEEESGRITKTVSAQNLSKEVTFSMAPQTGSLCLKLIRRDFIFRHHLHFPDAINWGEDLCFSLQALLLSSYTQVLDAPLYHYVQHASSVTHCIDAQRCAELTQCGDVIEKFLVAHQLSDQYATQLHWLKFQLKQYYLILPQVRDLNRWSNLYPESHRDMWQFPSPLYLRIAAWLIIHHLPLVAKLWLGLRDLIGYLRYLWL